MDTSISFSKIVSTPTLNAWSQAYSAGKLFAVLSLEKTEAQNQDLGSLNILGKDLFEKLEQEFFTIEIKDLESIKKAILNTFDNISEGITFSFVAGFINKNILYLFILRKGDVFIKRGEKTGILLSSKGKEQKDIISSSGFLIDNDLIILATNSFSESIAPDIFNTGLESNVPSEITESLAPKVHKTEDGRLAAIVVKYIPPKETEPLVTKTPMTLDTQKEDETEEPQLSDKDEFDEQTIETTSPQNKINSLRNKYLSLISSRIKLNQGKFSSKRKIFLIIAITVSVIFIFSIFQAIQNQNNAKIKAIFSEVYPRAEKKYEEGASLLKLNKNLAKDSFLTAQKILKDNLDKFPEKSKEVKQMQGLLKQIESTLMEFSPVDKSGLNRAALSVMTQNGSGIEGTAGKAAKILKEQGYNVTSTGNADNYNYAGVTIKVKKDKSNFLELLKKDLSKDYTVSAASSDLSSDSPTDALIIIGK